MHSKRAFSLVELSIVLVILGLLVGGVLGGQSLIRAAELRTITNDKDKFTSAVRTFKDKYMGLPGELANATSFWGAAHATPNTCKTTQGTGTQTCNGSGDDKVAITTDVNFAYEMYRFWQHLSNAGLIEGAYSGVQGPSHPWHHIAGTNTPLSKVQGCGWGSFFFDLAVTDGNDFGSDWGHTLYFGAARTGLDYSGPCLIPDEAYSIDTKFDDGKPGLGMIMAVPSTSTVAPNCSTTNVNATSLYNLIHRSAACPLIFRKAY